MSLEKIYDETGLIVGEASKKILCYPLHDPHRYQIEEHINTINRHDFFKQYIEVKHNEKSIS